MFRYRTPGDAVQAAERGPRGRRGFGRNVPVAPERQFGAAANVSGARHGGGGEGAAETTPPLRLVPYAGSRCARDVTFRTHSD